jgi:hypothetical protein
MKKDLQDAVHELTYYIELVIAVIMCGVIGIMTFKILTTALPNYILGDRIEIEGFLEKVMMLAIGLEFVKMLCKHTPSTVIDVLLFAIARQMIVEHTSTLENLIGVAALAGLFATRKYLLCHFDEIEKRVYRGSQKTKITNRMAGIKIPIEEGDTLAEVVKTVLNREERTIAIGACVWYSDFALRIDSMHGDKITRVEVIKSV